MVSHRNIFMQLQHMTETANILGGWRFSHTAKGLCLPWGSLRSRSREKGLRTRRLFGREVQAVD
jgi:hypothetical protein